MKTKVPAIVLYYFMIFSLCSLSSQAKADFDKELWPIWSMFDPKSTAIISHQKWQNFLTKYVVTNHENINLVDYSAISSQDKIKLKQYISTMAKINISQYNRDEQLAYWLNLYNAITVHIIASYYPIESIEEINISPGLFSVGPWGAKLVSVNHIPLSLDQIHNRIIRPIWNDCRTHYAISNGAIGAPNLNREAYQGSSIDRQLNDAAYTYVNSLRGVQVIDGELVVSRIYEWFIEDFGDNQKAVIAHLKQFANQPLKLDLEKIQVINNYVYNWHLNSTHY